MTDESPAFEEATQESAAPSIDERFQSLLDSDGVIRRRRVVAASLPEIQHVIDRAVRTLQADLDEIHVRIDAIERSLTEPPVIPAQPAVSPPAAPERPW